MSIAKPLIKQFPCPGCGSTLEFDPQAGQLKCPYCGREEVIPQSAEQVEERSYEAYLNSGHTQLAALSSTAMEADCPGCKAQITFEPPNVAGQCPFCNTSIVAQPHSASPVVAPEAVLPFNISQKAARAGIQKWLNSRWFAPNGLKKLAQQEGLQGVYLPFWTYDCYTVSHYTGERGTHYYVTETYTETNSEGKSETKTRQVQRTRWRSHSGQVNRSFDDILIPGSESVNTKRLEALEPWDLSKLVPYNASYLSGFKAQRYQVNLKQGFELAKGKMEEPIRCDIRRDIGGDEQRIHSVSTSYSAITFKHLLLPVWISAYRFNNKQYQVMVNAQTGEVLGDRPYSVWKISVAVLSALTIFGVVSGLFNSSQNPAPEQPVPTPTVPSTPRVIPGSPAAPNLSQPLQPDEAFRQAINTAGNAALLTQSAQTEQDWQKIVAEWERAIALLRAVPPAHPNYSTAQQKVGEYQRNLDYARQQARNVAE
jgi:ribosomal protein S27E